MACSSATARCPGALEVASLAAYTWPWLFALLVLIVVCFPEGRPASRARRRLAAGVDRRGVVTTAFGLTANQRLEAPLDDYEPAFALLGERLAGRHLRRHPRPVRRRRRRDASTSCAGCAARAASSAGS